VGTLMALPCIATGCAGPDDAARLRDADADFIAAGTPLWPNPANRLRTIGVVLQG
jgi:hypothetical protein